MRKGVQMGTACFGRVVAMAFVMISLSAIAAEAAMDGWIPHFYKGLEAAGSVEWLEKATRIGRPL